MFHVSGLHTNDCKSFVFSYLATTEIDTKMEDKNEDKLNDAAQLKEDTSV